MTQIVAPKLNMHAIIGPDGDEAAVTKLVMFVVLEPGEGDDSSNKQGHVHTQIIRRS